MRLKEVSIHNFRGIDTCQLQFHDSVNLIVGKNGAGKTSILESIAVGLGGFISGLDGVSTRNFTQDEIRTQYNKIGDGSYNPKFFVPIEISCKAEFNGKVYDWKRVREAYKSSRTSLQPRGIAGTVNKYASTDGSILPLISYQSAARTWMQKRDFKSQNTSAKSSRVSGYSDCLSTVSSRKQILAWCEKMEKVSWQKKKPVGEYEGAKAAVAKFMTILEGNHPCSLYYEIQTEELLYIKDETAETVSSLSAGYQSLIWMVFDIAYRMALLNPELREHISDAPGIVLIDEPDIHLHPEWQWLLVEALQQVFPNVQLIIASHSPIILASVKNGSIIDVSDINNIFYREPAYGLDINDTLRQIQESTNVPSEVGTLLNQFYGALDREDMDSARQIVGKIESLIGNRPIAVEVRTTYELESALGD